MNRMLTFFLLLVAPLSALPAADTPTQKPNIVFFLIDDLGYADCGFMGNWKLLMHSPATDNQEAPAKGAKAKANAKGAAKSDDLSLVNLATDPAESKNLAATEPERVAMLRAKLADLLKDAVGPGQLAVSAVGQDAPDDEIKLETVAKPSTGRSCYAIVVRLHTGEPVKGETLANYTLRLPLRNPPRSPVPASELERKRNRDSRDDGLVRKQSHSGFREAGREPVGTDIHWRIAKESAMDRSGAPGAAKTMSSFVFLIVQRG